MIAFIDTNKNNFHVTLLNQVVVLRGILAPNCFWYGVSDSLLKDGTGVELYNKYKKEYGDFAPTRMFGKQIYVVTNIEHIKTILDNSPDLFNVGELKKTFFRSFMSKNVGVSSGCPWKERRMLNEYALVSDKLHTHADKYGHDLFVALHEFGWMRGTKTFENFKMLGKRMVSKIVFGEERVSDDVFGIFSEANNTAAFYDPNFEIDPKIYNNYLGILKRHMVDPRDQSLIKLCMEFTDNEDEVLHQIPHFIFPIMGLFITTIPRLLYLLINHPSNFEKALSDNEYLRKSVLETLRLNNPVVTTFRTLSEDFTFSGGSGGRTFRKGTQFLILNNPVLREDEFFKEPNRFEPSRWNREMERSYYAISFSQGPQKCPGKELAIYLAGSFIRNLHKIVGKHGRIVTSGVDKEYIPQVINPCRLKFKIVNAKVE